MLFARTMLTSALWASALGSLAVSQCAAQEVSVSFTYSSFSVPGAVNLGVQSINDGGTVAGYFTDSVGDTRGFVLPPIGTAETLIDPGDTGSPGYTQANQITQTGTVFGEFYDDATTTYSGFIYKSGRSGSYTTYNVPGQPQYTTTGLYGGNDLGGLCGFVFPPPYSTVSAFVSQNGTAALYQIEGSTSSECYAMNALGAAAGTYTDSAGVYHGWVMSPKGVITAINVPIAASYLGTAPCVTGMVAGTVVLGINDLGDVSGHFWDVNFNQHGFLMTANGTIYQLDVPGAYQTAGGGLNNRRNVAGHYVTNSDNCALTGYIATAR